MNFREMTQSDVEFMKEESLGRGILTKQPEVTDYTFTLEHEGKILGVGGIRLILPTTAWAWVDITKYAEGHMILGYRVIKKWMESLVAEHGIKRLQAYVEPDFPEGIRMVEHLEFERESILEKFLPDGRDAFLYVRLLWEH